MITMQKIIESLIIFKIARECAIDRSDKTLQPGYGKRIIIIALGPQSAL